MPRQRIARFDATEKLALAEAFWPGPLTLVLPKRAGAAAWPIWPPPGSTPSRSGFPRIRWRRRFARFRRAGGGALGQSVGPCFADQRGPCAKRPAGRIDLIVDGGAVAVGVESTIVACFGAPMLLRPGGLPRGEIERVLGRPLVQPP
jgi:L-threonylcarbamoyladenylate synthase